jgi:hypothetical protein
MARNNINSPDFSSLVSEKFIGTQPYIELESKKDAEGNEIGYEAVGYVGKACDVDAEDLLKAINGEDGGKRKNKASYNSRLLTNQSNSINTATTSKANQQRAR